MKFSSNLIKGIIVSAGVMLISFGCLHLQYHGYLEPGGVLPPEILGAGIYEYHTASGHWPAKSGI